MRVRCHRHDRPAAEEDIPGNGRRRGRVTGNMYIMSAAPGPVRAWPAFAVGGGVLAIGAYFLFDQLDPLLIVAVLPLAVATVSGGIYAQRHDSWPPNWVRWVAVSILAGLPLYGGAYWIYGLAHPPRAV